MCAQRDWGLGVDLGPDGQSTHITAPDVDPAPHLSLLSKQDHLPTARGGVTHSVRAQLSQWEDPVLQDDAMGWGQTSPSAASSWGFLLGCHCPGLISRGWMLKTPRARALVS